MIKLRRVDDEIRRRYHWLAEDLEDDLLIVDDELKTVSRRVAVVIHDRLFVKTIPVHLLSEDEAIISYEEFVKKLL